jgi:predicted alpha-1,2-mannosidase
MGMSTLPVLALFLGCNAPIDDSDVAAPADDLPIEAYDPLPLVDPFIGTGGLGGEVVGLNPGASTPFGMTQTGPDTRHSVTGDPSFYHFGGYYYSDDEITAFSHEHANGMGVNDFGNIAVMPRGSWSDDYVNAKDRAAPFSHDSETASPGYYAVTLDDDATQVEIAATQHGAIHRYTFDDTSGPVVLLDLGHELGTVDVDGAELTVDLDAGTVDAFQRLRGSYSSRFGGLQTWAHLSFDPAPVAAGVWSDTSSPADGTTVEGDTAGTWLTFPAGTSEVTLRVSLSHVDADGALANHTELADSFDDLLATAETAWRDELSSVRVRGGTDDQRVIFHTALYHAYLWPNIFQDVDGRYRGMDGEVHTADFAYHSNYSMWDTFRTTHPWFTFAKPDKANDLAKSLVKMYEDGGSMPRWALGHGYTGGMVGTPAAQILAGTWLKGVRDWDAETGLDACLRHATGPMPHAGRSGIEQYLTKKYLPIEASGGSASRAVEYSWNDHALALWADAMGRTDDAAAMAEQSTYWQNHWDADQRFVVGRHSDGSFEELDSDIAWLDVYVEGDAWHYLWPAPYDLAGTIDLQHDGDADAFADRLSSFWDSVYAEADDLFPDDYYWHGNEPDLHYPWLGSLAGRPELTVAPVRHVMETRYSAENDGLDGNDDAGTLSSWYLFAAMGVYPVAGTTTYAVGSPIFERVEVDRPDGMVVISAGGTSEDVVVPTVTVDGASVVGVIDHEELLKGVDFRYGTRR